MAALQQPDQIREEIKRFLKIDPTSPGYTDDAETVLGTYLDDFAEIGSMLTDLPRCQATLAVLSDELRRKAKNLGMIKKWTPKNLLKGKKVAVPDTNNKVVIVDHKKILTSTLKEVEGAWGFNKGMDNKTGGLPALLVPAMPKGVATLTGFVLPDDFRDHLLKHAYHWKDAGVGVRHGEFTHRLHWFMVVVECAANSLVLKNQPVDVFRKLGESLTVGPYDKVGGGNKGIWDVIFDYQPGTTGGSGSENAISASTYRKPETLHAFLNDPVTQARKDLWVLSQLIAGRTNKRLVEKEEYAEAYKQELLDYPPERVFYRGLIFHKVGHD